MGGDVSGDWAPHELQVAGPVYPLGRGAPPLLEIITGSLFSGDGDQVRVTQILKYDPAADAFIRIYARRTGKNNNQEIRFITAGPVRGAVIAAQPTPDRPYAFWVTVDRFTADRTYRQVLRYRSATLYNDGNRLAVIDSEMPNILRRLGLWTSGPLPLPTNPPTPCRRPHLKRTELWCD